MRRAPLTMGIGIGTGIGSALRKLLSVPPANTPPSSPTRRNRVLNPGTNTNPPRRRLTKSRRATPRQSDTRPPSHHHHHHQHQQTQQQPSQPHSISVSLLHRRPSQHTATTTATVATAPAATTTTTTDTASNPATSAATMPSSPPPPRSAPAAYFDPNSQERAVIATYRDNLEQLAAALDSLWSRFDAEPDDARLILALRRSRADTHNALSAYFAAQGSRCTADIGPVIRAIEATDLRLSSLEQQVASEVDRLEQAASFLAVRAATPAAASSHVRATIVADADDALIELELYRHSWAAVMEDHTRARLDDAADILRKLLDGSKGHDPPSASPSLPKSFRRFNSPRKKNPPENLPSNSHRSNPPYSTNSLPSPLQPPSLPPPRPPPQHDNSILFKNLDPPPVPIVPMDTFSQSIAPSGQAYEQQPPAQLHTHPSSPPPGSHLPSHNHANGIANGSSSRARDDNHTNGAPRRRRSSNGKSSDSGDDAPRRIFISRTRTLRDMADTAMSNADGGTADGATFAMEPQQMNGHAGGENHSSGEGTRDGRGSWNRPKATENRQDSRIGGKSSRQHATMGQPSASSSREPTPPSTKASNREADARAGRADDCDGGGGASGDGGNSNQTVAKNMSFASTLYRTNNARVDAISDAGVLLRRSVVRGDGRCLFRAIVRCRCVERGLGIGVERVERDQADQLRQRAVDELKKHRDLLARFFVIEGDFAQYIRRMSQPRTYGGEPELLVLAKALHVPIAVYIIKGDRFRQIQVYGKQYRGEPLRILYSDGIHYDALLVCE